MAAALLCFQAAHSSYDHDEVQYLHSSWLVSQGQRPFQDFFEHHHPTLFYLLAPLTAALEGQPHRLIVAARMLDLACLAVLLVAFVAVARRVVRHGPAAWTALLLLGCFFFLRNSMEVRPDPWMAVFSFVGFWQWTVYLRGPGRLRPAVLAGLCLGTAIAFLPKAVPFAACVAVGTALALRGHAAWAQAARGAAVVLAAALLPVAALALAVAKLGLWDDFVFWTVSFNRVFYLSHEAGSSAMRTFLESVGESPLLWVGALWGLGLTARAVWRGEAQPELTIASVVTVGTVVALFRTRWPYGHNLLLMQPMLALLTAVALDSIEGARARAAVGVLLLVMVAKVCVLCVLYTESPGAPAVQRRVLAETEPSTPVAIPPPYNPIFRPNAFYFWFIPQNIVPAYLTACRLHGLPPRKVEQDRRVWSDRPPRFVYVASEEGAWTPFEFHAHRGAYLPTDLAGLWQLAPAAAARSPAP